MGEFYADAKFGAIRREYFPGTRAGDGLAIVASTVFVERWYPKGPVKIMKCGIQSRVISAGTGFTVTFERNGSTICTINASTTHAAWAISSKEKTALTVRGCDAGSYFKVFSDGTADSGSMVAFIDYSPVFHQSKWDVD